MQFRLSVEAEEDVIAIAGHGVRMFGPAQARRYHDDLFAVFDLISRIPRVARERKEISPRVRIHPFEAHPVVCRIEEGEAIFVIRVRHGHEDWVSDPG